jgi:uncharacterized membrane protein YphA (DoxX/SURF4 family)
MLIDPAPGLLAAAAFALLFATAAWHKWRGLPQFTAMLGAYELLPRALLPLAAPAIALLESILAGGLLLPVARAPAAMVAAALLIAYAGGIAVNLHRGRRDLDCGCTGPLERRPIAAWMVWRNVLLALGLGTLAMPWDARPLQAVDALTILGGLAAVTALYSTADRLLGQVMPRSAALRRGS